jgi:hypothetical protein
MRSVTAYQIQIDPSTTLAWAIEYGAPVISAPLQNGIRFLQLPLPAASTAWPYGSASPGWGETSGLLTGDN